MAFNKETILYWVEIFTHKKSEYTGSCQPKKKFSDVAAYIRENKFGKSIAGRVLVDKDLGTQFNYKYVFDGKDEENGYYNIRISHFGEAIRSMEISYKTQGAAYTVKQLIKKMEKELKDFDSGEQVVVEQPKVDYSGKEMPDLLEILDKKISEFGADANATTFNEILPVKEALDKKINAIPLAKRGGYSGPLSNLNMYISTLKTQLANPVVDVSQFAGTYVSQMQASVAQMASLEG